MKRLILPMLLLVGFVSNAEARGNKEKFATPVYEDQTNRTEFLPVMVGTTALTKVHTPRPYISNGTDDERHLRLQNGSGGSTLYLATFTLSNASSLAFASMTAHMFGVPAGEYLDLSPRTTYYAIWEVSAGSHSVRKQVDFHAPSGE